MNVEVGDSRDRFSDRRRRYALFLAFPLLCFAHVAGAEEWLWARRTTQEPGSLSSAQSIEVSPNGHIAVAGYFEGTVRFGNVALSNAGASTPRGGFLAKYDNAGAVLWAIRNVGVEARGVATDSAGNMYVTGIFSDPTPFGFAPRGHSDVFVAKYASDGGLVWATSVGGTSDDFSSGIAVDSSGNIFIAGTFNGQAQFGDIQLVSSGPADVFVARLNSNGSVLMATNVGGTAIVEASAITVDAFGHPVIAGSFQGSIDFNPDESLTSSLTPEDEPTTDAFVARLDPSGQWLWARKLASGAEDFGRDVAADAEGNIFFTGSYGSPLSAPAGNIFLRKFDLDGNAFWTKTFGGGGDDYATSVSVDTNGNVFIAGVFSSSLNLGSVVLISSGGSDLFVAKLSGSGNVLWAHRAGGTGLQEFVHAITTDSSGNAYAAGRVAGPISFGGTALSSSGNSSDAFVAKVGPSSPITIVAQPSGTSAFVNSNVTFSVVATGSPQTFRWFFNDVPLSGANNSTLTLANVQFAQAGSYRVVITNALGSVTSAPATLIVSELPPRFLTEPTNTSAFLGDNVVFAAIVSSALPVSYQWFFNNSPVATGGNGPTLSLNNVQNSSAGNYHVVATSASGTAVSGNAALEVITPPPRIITQPASTSVGLGGTATFSVTVASPVPVTFQWFLEDALILGANSPTLMLDGIQPIQAGKYHVVITSVAGSIASLPAMLEVTIPGPTIVAQPASASVVLGSNATFTVNASSALPTTYQWFFNDSPIAGGNGPTLALNNVQSAQAGNYHVIVSSAAGSVRSATATLQVTIPAPGIVAQPISVSVLLGSNATFTVTASSLLPLTYEWFFNGDPIPRGNGATLTLTNVDTSEAGNYHVLVSSPSGSVVSDVATLTVIVPPPLITVQPQSTSVQLGSDSALLVVAQSPLPVTYQWFFNGSAIANGGTDAVLNLGNVQTTHAGSYRVVVSSSAGSVTSTPALLQITIPAPTIIAQPSSGSVRLGSNVTFTVAASSTLPLTYQWFFNGAPLNGANGSSLSFNNVQTTQAGNYHVVVSSTAGTVVSEIATLEVTIPAPTISVQPSSTTVLLGSNAIFSVTASSPIPTTYQWFFNGIAIPGAINSSLALNNTQTTQAGSYHVVVSSAAGSVTSAAATLQVTIPAPTITTQPASVSVLLGSNAVFSVIASSPVSLAYQWFFNGNPITAGGNGPTLTLNNVQSAQAGAYHVVVTSAGGSVSSASATLQVIVPPPVISVQPVSRSVLLGTNVTFSVSASSALPLAYQWFFNGVPVIAGNASTLTLNNVQLSQAGSYHVVVSSAAGTVTSGSATLQIVIPPPVIASQPADASAQVGGSAMFSVVANSPVPLTYQWLFNGAGVISGGATSTLRLDDVQLANAGSYRVIVSSVGGSVTSSVAVLHVQGTAPVVTTQPSHVVASFGANAAFAVSATGTPPLSYLWLFEGLPVATQPFAPTFTLTNIQLSSAGAYSVVISNAFGTATSSVARLDISGPAPVIATQPASASVIYGGSVTFTVTASSPLPLSYQWLQNGIPLANANGPTLSLSNLQLTHAGNYTVVASNVLGATTSAPAILQVLGSVPLIVTHPLSASVAVGESVTFSVSASSLLPLSYRWFLNDIPVPGGTSPTLTLLNAQTADAARYHVVVSNALGAVSSATADLVVSILPPAIVAQPVSSSVLFGSHATFSVVATGSEPLRYFWLFNGSPITGNGSPSLIISNAHFTDSGAYSVIVSNAAGMAVSSNALLTVSDVSPVIITQPTNASTIAGGTVSFAVVASSARPLSYQWFHNGAAVTSGGNAPVLLLNNVQPAQAGSYYVVVSSESGDVTSFTATLQVIIPAPVIVTQPTSQNLLLGDDVSLSVAATSLLPLTYQWFFNGAPITGGGDAATLTLRNVQLTHAGNYHVVVSSAVGNVTSATAAVQVTALPPNIITSPSGVDALVEDNITLSVNATSSLPLGYQWFHNGVPIAGANATTLALNNIQPVQAGDYRVAVSNVAGIVNSAVATVRVIILPPTIATQPANISAVAGDDVAFSVVASSTLPVTHQWFRNGVAIQGAVGAVLNLNNVQAAQAGSYHVVVSSSAGNVTSAVATLEVFTPLPRIVAQPVNAFAVAGDDVAFSVTASSVLPVTYQWFQNGTALAGANAATLSLNNVQTTHAGAYHVVVTSSAGSTISETASLEVFVPLPSLVIQPASASVPLGGSLALAAGALSPVPLAYQWFFNGHPLTNVANSAVISLDNAQPSQSGDYFVVVSNSAGSVTSAVATVRVAVPLPVITSHPANASVLPGGNVTFDVSASSAEPLTYRWFFNGMPISERAISSSFTLASVQPLHAGDYYVVVGNSAGSVQSASARLQISGAAPAILTAPTSVDAVAGDNVSFSVTAQSDLPLSYQWYFSGVPIPGATAATLALTNVHLAEAGSYFVVVSNALGVATSAPATLAVLDPAPIITTQPVGASLLLGGSVTLFVAASSPLPLTYGWYFNDVPVTTGGNGPSLTLNNVQSGRAGDYYVVVGNSAGVVTSAVATIQVAVPPPVITAHPANASVSAGASVTFRVTATSPVPMTYRWLHNGAPLPGAANAPTLVLTDVQVAQAGSYSVVVGNAGSSVMSSPAQLHVADPAPVITAQPLSATVWLRSNATFRVTASSSLPLSYRWFHDGALIATGGFGATLILTNVQLAHAGEYYVVVSNSLGATVSSFVTLTVIDPSPVILAQPESASITAGESATFTVTALSDVPATYQWYFHGIRISGANASTLRVNNAQGEQAGNYHVVISNAFGRATSVPATLSVFGSRPMIVAQPASAFAALGSDVTFSVEGSSTLPLSYQWYVNGSPIPGANGPTLTLSRVQLAHAGIYFVVLSNGAGIATSGTATLQVSGSRPTIISQPASVFVSRGANVLFTVTASSVLPATYQWFVNGVPIHTANAATLTLANVQMAHAGNYHVVISNAVGAVASSVAKLELAAVPPVILTQPLDVVVSPGAGASFELVASSSLPMTYQWYFDGLPIPGGVTNVLTLPNVAAEYAGFYYAVVSNSVGSVTSATAVLAIAESAPFITTNPASANVFEGASVAFHAAATGTSPLTYHWFFNETPIHTGPQTSITLTNVLFSYAGDYYVMVSNALGMTASTVAQLQVSLPPPEGPLSASLLPTNRLALVGDHLVLAPELRGKGPFACQWWFNGKRLRGQTNATLVLSNVQLRARGQYQVEVRNSSEIVRSEIVRLTVVHPPKIVSQPAALTVKIGKRVTLRVAAAGTKPFFYQWFKDGLAIDQATNRFLTITNAQLIDTALYSVRVQNAGAYQDSVRARLTVVP